MKTFRAWSLGRYLELNGKYLKEADELLAKGDYVQASEKLWGAAAEMIKAIAAKRGLGLGTHRSIGVFLAKLDTKLPEWRLPDGYAHANNLHVNFYEDHLPPDLMLKSAAAVKKFIDKLRRLL